MHLRREKPRDLIYMRLQVEPPNDFIHEYIKNSFKLNQTADNAIIFNQNIQLSRSIVTSMISKAIFVWFSVTCPTTCWWPWLMDPLISCPTWRNSTWTTTTSWTSRTTCLVTYVGLRFCKYDKRQRRESLLNSKTLFKMQHRCIEYIFPVWTSPKILDKEFPLIESQNSNLKLKKKSFILFLHAFPYFSFKYRWKWREGFCTTEQEEIIDTLIHV